MAARYLKYNIQHILKEISANRNSPCELVRELISNSYDAKAKNILIAPLLKKRGIIFFDDGIGLSLKKEDDAPECSFDAFFSIGIEIKTKGEMIGHKCQGSKLCFDSKRFSMITKSKNETNWLSITIDNPRDNLDENYDIEPKNIDNPIEEFKSILKSPDKKTKEIINEFESKFNKSDFKQGTMLIVEGFSEKQYNEFFSVESIQQSYLYNYIRFYTIHGDVRRINSKHHFEEKDVEHVVSHLDRQECQLEIWMGDKKLWKFEPIPQGFPYIERKHKETTSSPLKIGQLRAGRFYERAAKVFEYEGENYTIIFAIDGRRAALDFYPELGRKGKSKKATCGISLSSQQGVWLSSQGIKVCKYDKIFDSELLEEFSVLKDNTDHYMFIIDGNFDLTTSRNSLAPDAAGILENPDFLSEIKDFLNSVYHKKNHTFKELLERLNKDKSSKDENQAIKNDNSRKEKLGERSRFYIKNIEVLSEKYFVEPIAGEEHFIGALYILLSHVIPSNNPLYDYWKRPLTFSGRGIDSIGVDKEEKDLEPSNLISLEYKSFFDKDEEFNHLLIMTHTIICWDFKEEMEINDEVRDHADYIGKITYLLEHEGERFGFIIGKIKKQTENRHSGHEVNLLSLKKLIEASFGIEWI
jgi:hypothetical protein